MVNRKISIIVPVYNVEQYLDRCVQSLIKQTYENIEIILVDDGSTDNCKSMCDEYEKLDERIYVIHKENGGLSDARNVGLDKAQGKYVLYVDSDDYIEHDSCERLLATMSDDIDFVVGACKEIRNDKITSFQRHSNIEENVVYKARDFAILSIKKFEWYAPAWLNLYQREFLINSKLYYRNGFLFEDLEMLPRLFLEASKVKYVDYPFYNYVIRENSIMQSDNLSVKAEFSLKILGEWKRIFDEIEDVEYRRYLYGDLIKMYLYCARDRKIDGWKIDGLDFKFALKYALGLRERLKVIYFSIAPRLYSRKVIYINFLDWKIK